MDMFHLYGLTETWIFNICAFSVEKTNISKAILSNSFSFQAANPSKLWDELFMRKMVNKIQDEIASPVDHLNSMEKTFGRMAVLSELFIETKMLPGCLLITKLV